MTIRRQPIWKSALVFAALLAPLAVKAQDESAAPARPAPPSILAILAHPDDEITIAPVLARVARGGGTVTLIYATSGDAGPGSSELEDSEEIAKLRESEGRCAAYALGLEEPVFWQLGDGALATLARAPDSAAKRALALTSEAIRETKPDVIMTWGPDGGYGHADHRMISAIVTQAAAELGPGRPDVLYAAFPLLEEDTLPQFEDWATTSDDLLTDRIRYEEPDLQATENALQCYESQFPLPARQSLTQLLHEQVWQGDIRFRAAFPTLR
ncbi:MAG: PIG-L family deacetylase [Pseudomonadota bacterium]